jgi:putative transposase
MQAPMCYVGGTIDHIHVLAAVRPSVSPAQFVKQLKGSSSRFITSDLNRSFGWQEGYGVFSVSERDVQRIISYIEHQKQHHAEGSSIGEWEPVGPRSAGP